MLFSKSSSFALNFQMLWLQYKLDVKYISDQQFLNTDHIPGTSLSLLHIH